MFNRVDSSTDTGRRLEDGHISKTGFEQGFGSRKASDASPNDGDLGRWFGSRFGTGHFGTTLEQLRRSGEEWPITGQARLQMLATRRCDFEQVSVIASNVQVQIVH